MSSSEAPLVTETALRPAMFQRRFCTRNDYSICPSRGEDGGFVFKGRDVSIIFSCGPLSERLHAAVGHQLPELMAVWKNPLAFCTSFCNATTGHAVVENTTLWSLVFKTATGWVEPYKARRPRAGRARYTESEGADAKACLSLDAVIGGP